MRPSVPAVRELLLPMMLPDFGVPWLVTIGDNMPGMAITLLESMELESGQDRILPMLTAWIVGTTGLGAWLFARRDAA